MRVDLSELKQIVRSMISEAKKSKKSKDEKQTSGICGQYADTFDFSKPLGAANLYKAQGKANFGPLTSPGNPEEFVEGLDEDVFRQIVRSVVAEDVSAWDALTESTEDSDEGPWDKALKNLVKGKK